MSYWFKMSNGFLDDPKLILIARYACVKRYVTFQTLHALLQRCSQNDSAFYGANKYLAQEISIQTDLEEADIESVLIALKKYEIIDDEHVLKWSERQGNKSTQRVRAYRERQKKQKENNETGETLRNVTSVTGVSCNDVTQNRIEKNRIDKKEKDKKEKKVELPEVIPQELWDEFLQYRQEEKKDPAGPRAQKRLINTLLKLHGEGEDISEVINRSIENGWKSFFQTKGAKNEKNNNRPKSSFEQRVEADLACIARMEQEAADEDCAGNHDPASQSVGLWSKLDN